MVRMNNMVFGNQCSGKYEYLGVIASGHVLHLRQWYLLAILVRILLQLLHDIYHQEVFSKQSIVALDVKTKPCNV